MTKILEESAVTLDAIAALLDDAGISSEVTQSGALRLATPAGLKFRILLHEQRKFLTLLALFPIRDDYEDRLEFVNRMNCEVFLPGFALDGEGDLVIDYGISYECGLIVPQFLRLVRRFYGMLDYVVRTYENEGAFDFNEEQGAQSPAGPVVLQ